MDPLFSRSGVAALPYRSDAGTRHSGALLTAVAIGNPGVATPAPDSGSLLEDAECRLGAPPGDPVALAVAPVRILEDRALRRRVTVNSAAAADRYTWETIAERHPKVYEAAIEHGP